MRIPDGVPLQQGHVPIFIVGCPRSGTTLVRLMLDSHPNISCGPETHFLMDLESVVGRHWHRIARFGFPREYWVDKIRGFFDDFQVEYAESRGKSRWADKSPSYTVHLPFVLEVFPTAQIVHVVRDPRDVVASHRGRWGTVSAVRAIDKWVHHVNVARRVGQKVGSAQYHEIPYEGLVTAPDTAMRRLLDFLREPWSPSVLSYEETAHDVAAHYGAHVEGRRSAAQDDGSSAVYSSRVATQDPLVRVLKPLILLRCGPTMRSLGYPMRRGAG